MLPGFIEYLILFLKEVGDLISQACYLSWREEFSEESSCQLIPSSFATRRQRVQQALALSLNEKGTKCWRIASLKTLFNFSASYTSKKTERCRFRSSKGVLPNWDYCTMEIGVGLSSKLLPSTAGRAMLKAIPWTPGVTKSWRVLLTSPAMPEFLLVSRLCSLILCFFLLKRKVLSISGLGSYKIKLRIN